MLAVPEDLGDGGGEDGGVGERLLQPRPVLVGQGVKDEPDRTGPLYRRLLDGVEE